jgi:hypothetical protein
MNLLIIQPSHYRGGSDRIPHKARKRNVVGLTLPYLAALTPRGWHVELIDEQLRDIDFNTPVDLVAITCWTINSFRAYDIADRFRERKVSVIIGGPHAYFYWEEASEHCSRMVRRSRSACMSGMPPSIRGGGNRIAWDSFRSLLGSASPQPGGRVRVA